MELEWILNAFGRHAYEGMRGEILLRDSELVAVSCIIREIRKDTEGSTREQRVL